MWFLIAASGVAKNDVYKSRVPSKAQRMLPRVRNVKKINDENEIRQMYATRTLEE